MSQPKEKIPVQKIEELARVLMCLQESTSKSIVDFQAAQLEFADVEGWKTLHRGLIYAQRIVKKICGPASPVQRLDVDSILLPHHKQKSKKQARKEADVEKLNAAAEAATHGKKRKPKSP
jgi:hypothetical protein